ncbi:MAG: hypothetical protein LBE81_12495 [Azonexus sp.]|jgi:predicted protein tyrosine phosphatase|uniref:hypothetical protein n=1 Tax=Azonexus sp. TaxID=1872668 RepID=UPI0028236A09|nr:hypothetical protein [Azonexus sp.]MDR0777437.1 hypothetical protein [Azonexus sp.]
MTISRVCYTSRQLAESLAGNAYMAVISITDPGTPPARLDPMFRHVLRLSFFDAEPADEYLPLLPGLFDLHMARAIDTFIGKLQMAPFEMSVMVHCEYGISRSAAVALFIEALTGAPLLAREFAFAANHWVIDRLLVLHPQLTVDIPLANHARERRQANRD